MPVTTELTRNGERLSLPWDFTTTQALWWACVRCEMEKGVPKHKAEKAEFFPSNYVYTQDYTVVCWENEDGSNDEEGHYAKTAVLDSDGMAKFEERNACSIAVGQTFGECGRVKVIFRVFEIKKGDVYRCWR